MKHTIKFFEKKYEEIQEFAKVKGIESPYRDIDDFISDYQAISLSSKNVMKDMKYNLQYETSYKTALTELRMLRELGDSKTKLKELKQIGTREFAEQHKEEIMRDYNIFKNHTGSTSAAKLMISTYWFGSE